jgi:hypothetical protein
MTLGFLPPCGVTVVLWSRLSGMTSIRVSLRLERVKNTKCYLMGNIENYTRLCTIKIDLSHLPLPPLLKPSGEGIYYHLDFEVILLFGLTELKALVAWKENVSPLGFIASNFDQCCQGVEQRSAAKIIYDPDSASDGL